MPNVSLNEFNRSNSELESLREANVRLAQQLAEAKRKNERLIDAVHDGMKDALISLGPLKPVPAPSADKRRKAPEAALWHLTDWQGAKVTPSYNSSVMRERVLRFVEKARKITEIQRADHPVKHCTIAFGGDMVEGLFNFPTQPFEIDQTLFGQFVTVGNLTAEVVRAALSIYETVTVVSEPGNHGRLGNKNVVLPRSDNLDRMTYELARQHLLDESRLEWDPDHGKEDIQRIEIGNYRALLIHGDEIGRGGFASPMTIVRHADRWKSGAYAWDFRDVYVGHYHNHAEWSMANGEGAVYQTGSVESENHYARDTMAASAVPSQRLHFVDTERGRVTSQYRILLDT
jgi:hypothetical protein